MLDERQINKLVEQQGLLHSLKETIHPEDIQNKDLQDMFKIARVAILQIESILAHHTRPLPFITSQQGSGEDDDD